MDVSVSPCEDFFRFACGSWISDTVIPDHRSKWTQFSAAAAAVRQRMRRILDRAVNNDGNDDKHTKADRLLRDLYSSCMDESVIKYVGLEAVSELMSVMNVTLPLLDTYASSSKLDLEQVLSSQLTWQMLDTGLFGLDVIPNIREESPKVYNLLIYQPFLALEKEVYTKPMENEELFEAYTFFLSQCLGIFAKYMAETRLWHLPTSEELESAVTDIIALESQLARITVDVESLEDEMEKSKQINFDHFLSISKNSKVNVARVVQNVVTMLTGQALRPSSLIEVPHISFFEKLGSILEKTSTKTLLNYLGLRVILDFGPIASRSMNNLVRWWTGDSSVRNPRWRHCVGVSTHFMGAKVSQLYIDAEHGEQKRRVVLDVVDRIKESFDEALEDAQWMDNATKKRARRKLSSMHRQIVRTHVELTVEEADKVYHDSSSILDLISNDSYVMNLFLFQGFWSKKALRLHNTDAHHLVDHASFLFDTTEVNAFYSPDHNGMWVPLGLLSPPFLPLASQPSLLFGSLGAVIGHEMSHGFDNMGSKFDKEGNFEDWWSKQSKEAFEQRQHCFIDQYDNITFSILDDLEGYDGPNHVDGENTLAENIADNVGLRQSYRAFESLLSELSSSESSSSMAPLPGLSWLSPSQLFFLSFGINWCEVRSVSSLVRQIATDLHAPSLARVNGVLANMPEFGQAFNCTLEQPMVKEEVCNIW